MPRSAHLPGAGPSRASTLPAARSSRSRRNAVAKLARESGSARSSCSMHATSHRASARTDGSRHARPRNRTAAASSFAGSALAIKTSSRAASSRSTWLRSEAAVRAASRSPPAIARRSFVSGDPWAVTNICSQRLDRYATGSIAVKPQRSLASSPMPPAPRPARLSHRTPMPIPISHLMRTRARLHNARLSGAVGLEEATSAHVPA